MNQLHLFTESYFWELIMFPIVMMLIIEIIVATKEIATKVIGSKKYQNRLYKIGMKKRLFIYSTVILMLAISVIFHYAIAITVFLMVNIYYIFARKEVWSNATNGYTLIKEKGLREGMWVLLNGEKEGQIKELQSTEMNLQTKEGTSYTTAYKQIKSIETFGEKRRVRETLVINFREDPNKAMESLAKVAEQMNEKYKNQISSSSKFIVKGIIDTNSSYHGMLYSVEGFVENARHEEASDALRMLLAEVSYQDNLKMAETNVYYRTRLSSK